MTWAEYNRTFYARAEQRLAEDLAYWRAVRDWLRRYGHPPDHPMVVEAERMLRYLEGARETVLAELAKAQPYRPGVDPWRTQGLSATLRPDFAARGITRREG